MVCVQPKSCSQTVHNSKIHRRIWDSTFHANVGRTAQLIAANIANSMVESAATFLDKLEQRPSFPYAGKHIGIIKGRYNLVLDPESDTKELVVFFDRFLPEKDRETPFNEWVPGLAQKREVDNEYFKKKLGVLFKSVELNLKLELLLAAEAKGIKLEEISHKLCWKEPLQRQLKVTTTVMTWDRKVRESWNTAYNANRDAMANALATKLLNHIKLRLVKAATDPFLIPPQRHQGRRADMTFTNAMLLLKEFFTDGELSEPFKTWTKDFGGVTPKKLDRSYFDAIIKDLFKRTAKNFRMLAENDDQLQGTAYTWGKVVFFLYNANT